MKSHTYTAIVEHDPETGLFVGTIPSIPGAHSQGADLNELMKNLQEVLELCLEEYQKQGEAVEPDTFIGVQKIAVNI